MSTAEDSRKKLEAVETQLRDWVGSQDGVRLVSALVAEIARATTELQEARRIDEATLERPVTL